MIKNNTFIGLVFILFTSFILVSSVEAGDRDAVKYEKELEDIERQKRETKSTLLKIKKKEVRILDEIEKVNKKVSVKMNSVNKVKKSIAEVDKKLSGAEQKINELESRRDVIRGRLDKRLRAIYKMREGTFLKVIFSSLSSEDLGKRYKYMSMVMASDRALIKEYEASLFKLEEERDRYDALKTEMEGQRKKLQKSSYLASLELDGKKRLLGGIKKEKKNHLAMVKELEDAAEELKGLLSTIRKSGSFQAPSGGFLASKGYLKMPVNGEVVSRYGKVSHPEFKTVTFNNGIVIDSEFGTSVRNVFSGKVAFVGWLKGYGQIVIVDHGEGFYTLYGYLAEVLKEKGDFVQKGDELGKVGVSGTNDDPGLYFEVRQKGTPKDPATWLSRR